MAEGEKKVKNAITALSSTGKLPLNESSRSLLLHVLF